MVAITRAIDVMERKLITIGETDDISDVVKLMVTHDISALPVVDAKRRLVGLFSEADLIHRAEIGTEKHRSWWMDAVSGASVLAKDKATAAKLSRTATARFGASCWTG